MGAVSSRRDALREKCEIREHVRVARKALRRMRNVGRYWRR
jgi:hypothetical protein